MLPAIPYGGPLSYRERRLTLSPRPIRSGVFGFDGLVAAVGLPLHTEQPHDRSGVPADLNFLADRSI